MFNQVIKSIIKQSGGSADKINLQKFMGLINDAFMGNPYNYWLGVRIQKNPLDLMILQEIIFEMRPDTIIECGTSWGGSAYYLACLLDLMKIDGKVITIDHEKFPIIQHPEKRLMNIEGKIVNTDYNLYRQPPEHPKIIYLHSDCLTAKIPQRGSKTMLILDCDHSAEHVEKELEKFSKMVTIGQYIIVEDTDPPDKETGPAAAIKRFLKKNKKFVVDRSREKFGISSNLGGYLLKVS